MLIHIPKDGFGYAALFRFDRWLLPRGVRDGHHKYRQQYEEDMTHYDG